ncbi:zinc knuckle CX2CX4HX4C containing protein [Tanacetum coccineum]
MGRDLRKSLDDMEYGGASSDGSDDRNDVEGVMNVNSDGNMVYDDAGGFVNQGSEDNRDSEGVNIKGSYGFNSTDSLNRDSELEDEVSNISKSNVVKNVEKSMKLSSNDENVVGDMPVPFSENVILNPGGNVANDSSNDVRGNKVNEVVRNVVWPNLNEVNRKDKGNSKVGNKVIDTDMLDSTSGKKSLSFISTFQGMSASGNNKLSRFPVRVNKDGNKVVDMDHVLEDGSKRWDLTLVGYFVGLKMSYAEISGHLRRMWRSHNLAEIITNEKGKLLFVQKWEAGLCMEKPEPTRVPIWVRIMHVPLEAWNSNGISRLASSIGYPIIMDKITASICEKACGRDSFARVLIEVDATKELPDSIEICYSKLGKSMKLRVEYAWKPPLCTHCKVFGHDYRGCTKRERTQEEISVKSNRSGASTSNNVDRRFNNGYGFGYRGGYNVRGRGGRGGIYQKENNESVGMKFVPVRNVGKRVDNVQVMEGEGSGNRANKGKNVDNVKSEAVKKTYEKKPVTVKNSFDALAEDSIDESEKKRWSDDLIKYYADKCEAKARQNLIDGLKWRIAKLKQDIVANEEAQKQCVALMKTDGITRNQAFGKIYDETYRSEPIKINDMRLEQQRAKVELFFYSKGVLSNAVRET